MTSESIVEQLRCVLGRWGGPPSPARTVAYRPATWRPWCISHTAASAIVDQFAGAETDPTGQITRADLVALSSTIGDADDTDGHVRLFVATMLWGSGTSNGRGPRFTGSALDDGHLVPSLIETRSLILDGDPARAYAAFRSRGVGPAFFTKWLWAAGLDRDLEVTPLILDARVWASLRALGWDSREAAGSKRWAQRYLAYLRAMARWSDELSPAVTTPEQLEQVLFKWAGSDAT